MKKIQLSIAEEEIIKYGLKSQRIEFDELVKKIKLVIGKEALLKCQDFAWKAGLDKMTFEEIDSEIQAVRDAKNNH